MSLVPWLLQAIVSVDGEALVMHAGEKPYVVASSGQVELAKGGLSLDAVGGVVTELLPADVRRTLMDVGAVQYDLPIQPDFPREQFTVIAARGDDDIWAEIRRRRLPDDERGPEAFVALPAITAAASPVQRLAAPAQVPTPVAASVAPDDMSTAQLPWPQAPSPSVVVPMLRGVRRGPSSPAPDGHAHPALEHLLRKAIARGASMLYLVADARPSVRVGGALQLLDDEPVLDARDLAPLLMNVAPGSSPSALDAAAGGTWTSEFDGIGRVHGAIFRDRRGPVGILRIVPHAPLPEWLDLPPEIQAFAAEDDGLVLVAGPRSSGKRTLLAALVDRVNRTRCAHVITIGQGDGIAHASRQSVVSQRDVTGGDEDMLAAARGALREAPDVLVLDAIRTAELMNVALDAAASGCLVFGGLLARNATAAIDRAVTLCAPAHASRARLCLAEHRLAEHRLAEYLRGVVAQRLVPRAGGGCLAVREVLANTPALADAIANGRSPDAA